MNCTVSAERHSPFLTESIFSHLSARKAHPYKEGKRFEVYVMEGEKNVLLIFFFTEENPRFLKTERQMLLVRAV